MRESTADWIGYGFAMTIIIGGFTWVLADYLDLPIVQVDHLTGECLQVLPEGDCSRLPEKYIVEQVNSHDR